MEDEIKEAIKALTKKVKNTHGAINAQQYAQAVLNLSTALGCLDAQKDNRQ